MAATSLPRMPTISSPCQDHAGDRVDQAEEEDLARHGPEVGEALPQRRREVGRADPAHDRALGGVARTGDHVKGRHGRPSLEGSGPGGRGTSGCRAGLWVTRGRDRLVRSIRPELRVVSWLAWASMG